MSGETTKIKPRSMSGHTETLNFAPGGSFADVIETLDQYGVVPDEVYTGLLDGAERHDHGEMDKVLSGYMKGSSGIILFQQFGREVLTVSSMLIWVQSPTRSLTMAKRILPNLSRSSLNWIRTIISR